MNTGTKSKKTISLTKNKYGEKVILIKFPYDLDLLFKIRDLPGRIYLKESSCWTVPLYKETINELIKLGFVPDTILQRYLQRKEDKFKNSVNVHIQGLGGILRPFQSVGVMEIEARGGNALLADEMGLGKTIQTLAWLQLRQDIRPVLIVAPAIAKLHWARKIEEWMIKPVPNVEVLSGERPWIPTGDILIINYDVLPKWIKVLQNFRPEVLIMDECHYIKNNKAKRTKAVKILNKIVQYRIPISGTPFENRPVELYNAVNMVDPALFPNFWTFTKRYCKRKRTPFGWDYSGASHMDELHDILIKSIMIRRLKKDVLKELPAKDYSFVPIELSNKKEYISAQQDWIAYVQELEGEEAAKKAKRAKAFASTEGLKQLAVKGKLNNVILWIQDFLESDQKLVVFAHHKFVVKAIMEAFPNISVKIDGSSTSKQKQQAEDMFQNDPKIHLFVGNMKAAGVVITLTAASNIAIIELPWTPGTLSQAIDRCHRIGQEHGLMVHYLLAVGTIEEKIATLLDKKLKVFNAVLNGEEVEEGDLLMELINQYLIS